MSLGQAGRLTLLRVSGSPYEQGYQHGKLLAERIPDGTLSYFAKYLKLTIRNSSAPWLERPMLWWLRERVSKKLVPQVPHHTRELVRGLAEGSGQDYESLLETFSMPDTFLALIGYWQKTLGALPVGQVAPFAAPVCGCTSVIARGPATADGKLYHARNFDYPAVGYWDRDPVVLFNTPDEGLPYMSIVAAGVPAGGVTGMNAAGISLAIHQHWLREVDLKGVPVGVAGEAALRQATSIDEAIRIILDHPTVSGWTYLISDGESREAVALEVAPGRHGVVRLGETGVPDALGYSNAYLSRDMQNLEIPLIETYWDNCVSRLTMANRLLQAGAGRHTPRTLATILGDDTEPTGGEHRLFGNVIPMLLTVATVVFDPEDRVMWIGESGVPASHGRFIPFSLADQDVSGEDEPFETPGFGAPARREAYAHYVAAYRAAFEHGDSRGSLVALRNACEAAPAATELWQLRGFVALRAGEPAEAALCLRRALERQHDPIRVAEGRLALAHALDLSGGRAEARELYGALAGQAGLPARIRKAARLHRHLPFPARKARRIPIDFTFGGLL